MPKYVGVIFAAGEGTRLRSVTKGEVPKHLLSLKGGNRLPSTLLGRLVHQLQKQPEIRSITLISGAKHNETAKWLDSHRGELTVPVNIVAQPEAGNWGRNLRVLADEIKPGESALILSGDTVVDERNIRSGIRRRRPDKPFVHVVFSYDKLRKNPLFVSSWATNKMGVEAALDRNPESWKEMLGLIPKVKRISFSYGKPVINVNTPEGLKMAREHVAKTEKGG